MTTGVLTQPVHPTGVERYAQPRGKRTRPLPTAGNAPHSRPGVSQIVARPPVAWRSGLTRPGLRLVAGTTLRTLLLISVAILLILVLLPVVLSAQWASVG